MLKLDEKYAGKQEKIDKEFAAKKKALETQAAKREKKKKLANAIMSTAHGIAAALPLIPLAILVGAMGAAQIAAIASTPIPMAQGGLAFGPVNAIVGDNPGAANDPEVVAPLSKLKSMLGGEMNVALNVAGIVKGGDIWLSYDETSEQRPRYI